MAHSKGNHHHGATPGRNASIARTRSSSNYDDGLYIVPPPWPNVGKTRKYKKIKIEDLHEMLGKLEEWAADAKPRGMQWQLEKAYNSIDHIVRFYYNDGVFKGEYE